MRFSLALAVMAVAVALVAAAAAAGSPAGAAAAAPAAAASCASAAASGAGLPFCVQLNPSMALRYGLAGNSTSVVFALAAQLPPGTRWAGVGLSELGSMTGADIALLSQPSDGGAWRLVDAWAPGFQAPVSDDRQSLQLLNLTATSGELTAVWSRDLNPCQADPHDLSLQPGMPLHFIWAHGSTPGAYHGPVNRGSVRVRFAAPDGGNGSAGGHSHHHHHHDAAEGGSAGAGEGQAGEAADGPGSGAAAPRAGGDADVRVRDLVFRVNISTNETSYYVHYFELPADRKYHILRYEPVTGSGLLHHGVAYTCSDADEAAVAALPGRGPFERFGPRGMMCERFFMVLTPNMSAWVAPPAAGLPFGAGVPHSRLVALELHYNNPDGLQGQADATGSGIRIYFTPHLRSHDIGWITLDQPVLNIPPGQPRVAANVSVCPSACTSARLRQPLQLLDVFMHMHGLGSIVVTRHFRGASELPPLGSIAWFDYAYQDALPVWQPSTAVLLPGDALTLGCTYDSRGRSEATHFGPGTQDEMCFAWVSFFPAAAAPNFGMCFSFGDERLAVCSADAKLSQLDASLEGGGPNPQLDALLASGALLRFAGDPAVNATAYQPPCSGGTAGAAPAPAASG